FRQPRHPYTAKLIAATPEPHKGFDDLIPILGSLPDLRRTDLPPCRFVGRCDRATEQCHQQPLRVQQMGEGHWVGCWEPLGEER
ncbi:MAG: oligopeptide/dipeptide ABC transporter ATP-binding protein, partial [Cyanobacteria bacterium J06635_1]